jgi:D-glycero-D-manno-heptose 1,7-bisphosphate phosphatase
MLFALAKKHWIDLANSYMVGDRLPDIEAGKGAGAKTVLIGTREKVKSDNQFSDLLHFVRWLLR